MGLVEITTDILLFVLLFPGCYMLLLIVIHKILTTLRVV